MLVILVFMLGIQQCFSINENQTLYKEVFQYHNLTAQRALFAEEVVNKVTKSFHQRYYTITFCKFTYFENRILKYTESYRDGYNVMLLNGCSRTNNSFVKPRHNKHGRTTYIVTSDNLDVDMSDFVVDAFKSTGVFKPRSAVIFVIINPVEPDEYFYNSLKTHFQLLWSRSIANSVLILKSSGLKVYSYNPFLEKVRDITDVEDVGSLLQKQYHNLHKYKLRLSVFRKIYISDKIGPVLCDSNLAKTVMNFINASCVPVLPRDDSTVGDLLDNGTATGVTADLMDNYSELELSSRILKNTYYGYIDTTYPFVQDALCLLIKKSGTKSAFNTVFGLITLNLLFLFVFSFFFFVTISLLVWKIEKKALSIEDKHSTGGTIMDVMKCFLRQTVEFIFAGPVFRLIILLIILYSLIVNCAIDGIITTAITYPHYKPDINSISELKESDLIIGIHNRDINMVNKSFSTESYEQIKNRIELVNDRKIKEVIDKKQFQYALLLRKSDSIYISRKTSNMENGKPLFYIVPECPLPCFIVYGLRYGSPYLPRINYILQQLTQSGILQYWNRLEQNNVNPRQRVSETKEKKALSIFNIGEMFYVLLFGEAISTLVFIAEIVWHRFKMNIVH